MESLVHPVQPTGAADAFVARHAIFDRELNVVGYELLFRGAASHTTAQFTDRDHASTRVILDTFLHLGLDTIVGHIPAFLNLTRNFFLSAHNIPLPRDRVVLELLEGERVDAPLVAGVRAYAERGFRIALDDFVYHDNMIPLLEIADIVKFDVLELTPSQIEAQVRKVMPYGVVLLAEKVETPEYFEFCKDLGFELYQGYFQCRPKTVTGHRIVPNRTMTLRSLARLQDPDLGTAALEQFIRDDLALSYKLLRLVNSSVQGPQERLESIPQILAEFGAPQVRAWVGLLVLSQLEDRPGEPLVTAMVRARMCEQLASRASLARPEIYFTVGLVSALDDLLDLPMEEVLQALTAGEELRDALSCRTGAMGAALDCVVRYERGDWDAVGFPDLPSDQIRAAYFDAVGWARVIGREIGV